MMYGETHNLRRVMTDTSIRYTLGLLKQLQKLAVLFSNEVLASDQKKSLIDKSDKEFKSRQVPFPVYFHI